LLLGEVFLELKNPKRAQDQFEAASLLDPSSVQAQLGVARAQIAEGDASSAVKQLSALSDQSKSPEILDVLAEAFRSMGNEKQAQQAAGRAKLLRQNRRQ
jgi:predicted Zn-dependent protease